KFQLPDKVGLDKLTKDNPATDRGPRDRTDLNKATDRPATDRSTRDKSATDTGTDKSPSDKKIVNPPPPPPRDGPFPRRALLISVCNYLYANPLHYGTPADDAKLVRKGAGYPGSSTGMLKFLMEYSPMNLQSAQMAELTDGRYELRFGKPSPAPTVVPSKRNIERGITEFLNTSRPQDRILLLFAGHAVDVEKESYLVP